MREEELLAELDEIRKKKREQECIYCLTKEVHKTIGHLGYEVQYVGKDTHINNIRKHAMFILEIFGYASTDTIKASLDNSQQCANVHYTYSPADIHHALETDNHFVFQQTYRYWELALKE